MRIRCIFVIVLVSTVIKAQVNIGIIGGLNVSTLQSIPRGLLTMTNDNNFGFGTVFEYQAEDNFSLNLGTLLLNKGANFTIEGQDNITAVTNLMYFNTPLTLHYSFGAKPLRPYILGGVFGEYNLKSGRKYYNTPDGDVAVDMTGEIDRYNYGFLLGGGIHWIFGENALFIETQYSQGRRDIDTTNDAWVLKTREIQTFIGLKHTIF